MQITVRPGNTSKSADGTDTLLRGGNQNEIMASQLHGRFYEQAYRGNLFSGGMVLTSISNATFTKATTDATATPIVGLWNPLTSGVNCVLLQAIINAIMTAATNTGCGGFTWQTAVQQNAITTGNTPLRRNTLIAASPNGVKDMSGVACTGLSGALSPRQASAIGGGSSANFSFVGTAVGQATPNVAGVENIDGSIIVPPGGLIGLFANTTPVAHSAVAALLWEEVPV